MSSFEATNFILEFVGQAILKLLDSLVALTKGASAFTSEYNWVSAVYTKTTYRLDLKQCLFQFKSKIAKSWAL